MQLINRRNKESVTQLRKIKLFKWDTRAVLHPEFSSSWREKPLSGLVFTWNCCSGQRGRDRGASQSSRQANAPPTFSALELVPEAKILLSWEPQPPQLTGKSEGTRLCPAPSLCLKKLECTLEFEYTQSSRPILGEFTTVWSQSTAGFMHRTYQRSHHDNNKVSSPEFQRSPGDTVTSTQNPNPKKNLLGISMCRSSSCLGKELCEKEQSRTDLLVQNEIQIKSSVAGRTSILPLSTVSITGECKNC